jgi:hypothetical protein
VQDSGHDARLVASGLVRAVRYDDDAALRAALRAALIPEQEATGMTVTSAESRPVTGGGSSYEEEMIALIDRMRISDEQRRFLRSRWLGQVTYMGERATEAKRRYYWFRLSTVIGGVIVPALVSISLAASGRFDPNLDFLLRLLTFVVSALVAVTAAVEGFFHFGDRWRHYRVNAELLKSEGWQYLTDTGPYRRIEDPDIAFQSFASRVEEVLRDDVEGFMSNVARSSPIEKHDIFTKV